MKDNNYSRVEGMLYGYPDLKIEIENLKIDLEEAYEVVGIRGSSGLEKAGSPTYAVSSSVESEVINRDEKIESKIQAIKSTILKKERQLKRIDNILSKLTEDEYLLIELRYFKRYRVNRICDLLDVTKDTVNSRRRNIIVKQLIPLIH